MAMDHGGEARAGSQKHAEQQPLIGIVLRIQGLGENPKPKPLGFGAWRFGFRARYFEGSEGLGL